MNRLREIVRVGQRFMHPAYCELCQSQTELQKSVCESCEALLIKQVSPYCLTCAEPIEGPSAVASYCSHCYGEEFSFAYAVTAFVMDPALRKVIHTFKYQKGIFLAEFLGRSLKHAFEDERLKQLTLSEWVVTSVPIHQSRLRERYYNQAEELAYYFCQEMRLPYENLLLRVRPTEHQTKLTKAQRAKNMAGAVTRKPSKSTAKKVILIDDVFTTGATVNECAKVLKKAGVEEVIVLCIARQ